MAMKSSILLITLLVVFVAPQANAIGLQINGLVLCPLNGSINVNVSTNGTIVPRVPVGNATVQVAIGRISLFPTTTTNSLGQFTLNLIQSLFVTTGNFLRLVTINVTPPPTACNSTLPVNSILQSVSPLQLVNQTLLSITLNVTVDHVVPLLNV